MRRKEIREALVAAEAEKRKRATMAREQAERNRDDIRSVGDSVRVLRDADGSHGVSGGIQPQYEEFS